MLTEVFPESVHVSQLFSTVLCNLVFGELIQAKRDMGTEIKQLGSNKQLIDFDAAGYMDSYIAKTYYKIDSMIRLGCRGVAVLMDFNNVEAQKSLFNFGAHLGIAFQIHDDILDFT